MRMNIEESTPIIDDLVIFEMANNHQGSVDHGLRIVDAAAELAQRHETHAAVKLQFRELDSFIHPEARGRTDIKHIPRFESTRLDVPHFRRLVHAIHDNGLISVATPFDEASVELCRALNVNIIKIASCSATDWPLLEAVVRADRPVIASTGGLSIPEIDNLATFLSKRVPELALMHCVSLYPTPPERQAMNFLSRMIRRYPFAQVGYSGHESPDDTDVAVIAIAKGARLLERHFGVPYDDIVLNGYSMNPQQADRWLGAVHRARAICGDGEDKHVAGDEHQALLELQRGVYARRDIEEGETISRDDVFFAMPCTTGQLSSGRFGQYRTRYVASHRYRAGDAVTESPQRDPLMTVRGVLHDARGLLYEAGIQPGDNVTIEVSHHYGIDRCRETGCILVNAVNREYCNKFIIMLPGQRHPQHKHRLKEETFHVLWGDLEVLLEEQAVLMRPGDRLLVERGKRHAFSSRNGCVFAEISTHSERGDSYYADPEIAAKDPLERKTIVERW
jgi:N-acetylneuraminate synthase